MIISRVDHLSQYGHQFGRAERVAAAPVVGDCGSVTGDFVGFGFVGCVQGAEHEICFVVGGVRDGDMSVELLRGLEDGDVDDDHFGWVLGGGLV